MNFSSIRRLFKALGYSWDGLRVAAKNEASFQLEIAFSIVLIPVAFFLHVGVPGKALLIGSVLLVLIVELLNTAVEAIVDRISLEPHPLAKKAKDTGSAAVFLTIILACCVWGTILFS